MNFFYLHIDPFMNARSYCLEHRKKMIVEYGQILSTIYYELEYSDKYELKNKEDKDKYKLETGLYLPTHKNHPVVKWARESYQNRRLMFNVMYYLSELYYLGSDKSHKTDSELIPYLHDLLDKDKVRGGELTVPPKCMPDEYKVGGDTFEDVIQSYRNYYIKEKSKFATFDKTPDWWVQ